MLLSKYKSIMASDPFRTGPSKRITRVGSKYRKRKTKAVQACEDRRSNPFVFYFVLLLEWCLPRMPRRRKVLLILKMSKYTTPWEAHNLTSHDLPTLGPVSQQLARLNWSWCCCWGRGEMPFLSGTRAVDARLHWWDWRTEGECDGECDDECFGKGKPCCDETSRDSRKTNHHCWLLMFLFSSICFDIMTTFFLLFLWSSKTREAPQIELTMKWRVPARMEKIGRISTSAFLGSCAWKPFPCGSHAEIMVARSGSWRRMNSSTLIVLRGKFLHDSSYRACCYYVWLDQSWDGSEPWWFVFCPVSKFQKF